MRHGILYTLGEEFLTEPSESAELIGDLSALKKILLKERSLRSLLDKGEMQMKGSCAIKKLEGLLKCFEAQ